MATQLAEGPEAAEEAPANDIEQQSPARDFEAEARAQGWRPKEEFRGDPAQWTDAETFVKRADEVMPLIKKQNAHLKSKVDQLEKMVKRVMKSEQAAYENAVAALKAEQEEAVESGDIAAFRAVDKKLDRLKADIAEDAPGRAFGEDPMDQYDSFREDNAWYDKGALAGASEVEKDARVFADRLADKYARQGLDKEIPPSEFFARIAAETAEKFPALSSKAPRPKPPSDVAGVTRSGGSSAKAKTGVNLPAEAKAQATRFFNMGIIKGKSLAEALDTYAKSYDWS